MHLVESMNQERRTMTNAATQALEGKLQKAADRAASEHDAAAATIASLQAGLSHRDSVARRDKRAADIGTRRVVRSVWLNFKDAVTRHRCLRYARR